MGGELLPVRVGMGIMPRGESGFFLRVVGRVRVQVVQGVVLVLFCMAFLVLAGVQSKVVRRRACRCFRFVSWWHNSVILLLPDKPAEGTRTFTSSLLPVEGW